jgi:hypothetical protein
MNPSMLIDDEWDLIPGWCSHDKRNWMRSTVAFCKGDAVDIGVWGGRSSFALATGLTDGRILWTIDPYSVAESAIEDGGDAAFQEKWNKVEHYTNVRIQWLDRLVRSGLLPKVRMLETTDEKACQLFEDGSLGFVHVDGNHGAISQYETTVRWFRKLMRGGVLLQDDTNIEPVQVAAVPAADSLGIRIREDATPQKKWIAWRKR